MTSIDRDCVREHIYWGRLGAEVVIGDRRSEELDLWSPWSRLRSEPLERHWWLSFFTGNASVDRSLLDRVGGFDPSLQYWGLDDTDLGFRLFRAGASVFQTPRCFVTDLAPDHSGGGVTGAARAASFRLHAEVLYRKTLDSAILEAFDFLRDAL